MFGRIKTSFLVVLLGTFALGCHSHYQLTLNNGNQITTANKPKLINGYYVFKDVNGNTNYVSQTRVKAIEPRSRGYGKEPASTTYRK